MKDKTKNKTKSWIKLILGVFVIIALVVGGTFTYTFYKLSKINTTTILKTDEDLGIKPNVILKEEVPIKSELPLKEEVPIKVVESNKIINIAFFGVDRRTPNEPSRSDSIMILSVDEVHKKVKMSSIMRDTYVDIKNHGDTKINHAYAYGGPQLAIRTLNENFNLDIRDYVTVDFFNLEKIIDAMGGVTIDVKQNEISFITDYMTEVANIEKKSISQVTKPGLQNLNGLQAVAYSRIRYTAGGDFVRTERQRTVLAAMLTKIQSLGISEFASVVSKVLPYTETSMKSMDIIKLGTKVLTSNIATLDQERFPLDGYCKGKMMDGVWYLVADMGATTEQVHKYIYEDVKPTPKAPLF
ncbi:LCP family protein [Clostridium bowmanii]|uniref:LCP family protein n=1 Tax=Clostridium bowmanii TaxID=132925 RepID=UPI001C0C7392|nr:LCP family protein [Clostridium bowmanii]MBU3191201.1 LCP family protein [Clostridium bowmanii]MCA1075649.1 LCP family protein [Clostridium bowmanii]